MIAQTLRGPHNLYRRYQASLESTLTALGLATVVTLTLHNLATYPANWVVVIGLSIAMVGVRWPSVAYAIATTIILYPIFLINLYLAVLVLALSALGQRFFVHYLGATVLVLATPILAQYHLHWLVPILAGLWWGGAVGAWVGGLAAFWGKVVGGVAGMNIDWLVMAGHTPSFEIVKTRFHDANSLKTLLLLVEPFATTSNVILYNLLQVLGWALAAGFVGALAWRRWVKYSTPWSALVLTAGGGLIMLAVHLGLPRWLNEATTPEAMAVLRNPMGPLFSLLTVIIIGTVVYSLRESLDLPVAPPRSIRRPNPTTSRLSNPFNNLFKRPVPATTEIKPGLKPGLKDLPPDAERPHAPVRVPHYSELPEWEPPRDESGLIMLEID